MDQRFLISLDLVALPPSPAPSEDAHGEALLDSLVSSVDSPCSVLVTSSVSLLMILAFF